MRQVAIGIAGVVVLAACASTSGTPMTVQRGATTTQSSPATTVPPVTPTTAHPSAPGIRDIGELQSIANNAKRALVYVSDENGVATVVAGEGTNGQLIQPDDTFFIGSGSKMITAAAILQLVDQGLVDLDDLLADYVDFDVTTPITIRHLLQHKSGLGDNDEIYNTCDPAEVLEGLAELAADPANPDPGTQASYSTNGFNMLSLVLSSATGLPAADVVRQNIFEPLSMTSTFFTGAEDGPQLVVGEDSWDSNCAADKMDIGTGGGFASSARDLDTFMRALFEGDLLSEKSLDEMTTIDSRVYGTEYGLGLGVLYPPSGDETPMYGHWGTFGWDAGALYDPQAHRTIVVLVVGTTFQSTVWPAAAWANGT